VPVGGRAPDQPPLPRPEWGLPVRGERGLFERISLEAFQVGLSWLTILSKRPAFRVAFCGFDPEKVAAFSDGDVERLLRDRAIVRNRATSTPASKALAADLRAHGFVFVGPTTAWALMEAVGLVDAHLVGCHRRGSGY
jgi:DNA-3-methyladenine glycosylase I